MEHIGQRHLPRLSGRNMVAAVLAVLLAIAPFADRGLIHPAGGALSVQSSASDVDALAQTREPVTAPRASQSSVLGVLSRLITGESKLGPTPGNAPFVVAGEREVALSATPPPAAAAASLPRRSTLPSAHPATGPPA